MERRSEALGKIIPILLQPGSQNVGSVWLASLDLCHPSGWNPYRTTHYTACYQKRSPSEVVTAIRRQITIFYIAILLCRPRYGRGADCLPLTRRSRRSIIPPPTRAAPVSTVPTVAGTNSAAGRQIAPEAARNVAPTAKPSPWAIDLSGEFTVRNFTARLNSSNTKAICNAHIFVI